MPGAVSGGGQCAPGKVCAWGSECMGQWVPGAVSAWGSVYLGADLIKLWDVEEESESQGQCVPGAVCAWGQ